MSLHLSRDELYELTKRKQHKKQIEELNRLKVPVTVRWDGFPLVPRSHFEQKTRKREPNFAALKRA
jgi:hypothetical protein